MPKLTKSKTCKKINLALQGGGSHGAFTWGVLDKFLEETCVEIIGISGTSAGAMNAAVLAYGIALGGKQKARELLAEFWERIAKDSVLSPLKPTLLDKLIKPGSMEFNPFYFLSNIMNKVVSPYQWNVFDINPLSDLLDEMIDFKIVQNSGSIQLFICATNVKTGKIKIFKCRDLTKEVIMASACLPFLFKAVEIDGKYYWDGGYMGNPALYPLFYETDCSDVLIVQINPIQIEELPTGSHEILDRINTISFNSSLMRELRAINFVHDLVDKGFTDNGRLKKIFIHMIQAEKKMEKLGISSKLNTEWSFLKDLFELGREYASVWIEKNWDKIGKQSSCDISQYL